MHYLFQEMKSSIYSEEDKILFEEVLICFNSGAYRAAYILNWICIAESLKLKIRYMSNRDGELASFIRDMDEGRINSIDDQLIIKSKSIHFINELEKNQLSYIRQMRNEYAHPNNVSPDSDEVMGAIRTGVNIVLSREPLLRQGYIRYLLESMRSEYHFLDDNEARIQDFTKNIIEKINIEVYPFLLKNSVEELESIYEDDSVDRRYMRRLYTFVSTFLEEVSPDLSEEHWELEILLRENPKSLNNILLNKKIYPLCDEFIKDRIISSNLEPIINNEIIRPSYFSLNAIYHLKIEGLLTLDQESRLDEIISNASYSEVNEIRLPISTLYDRIINDLKSYNYYVQNPAVDYLLGNIGQISELDYPLQIELGRNILQSAEGGSNSAINFVENFELEDLGNAVGMIEGIILETFANENNEFRIKGLDYLERSLRKLCSLNYDEFEEIITRGITKVEISTIMDVNIETKLENYKRIIASTSLNVDNTREYLLTEFLEAFDAKLIELQEGQGNL